jgi:hypothetical protein
MLDWEPYKDYVQDLKDDGVTTQDILMFLEIVKRVVVK